MFSRKGTLYMKNYFFVFCGSIHYILDLPLADTHSLRYFLLHFCWLNLLFYHIILMNPTNFDWKRRAELARRNIFAPVVSHILRVSCVQVYLPALFCVSPKLETTRCLGMDACINCALHRFLLKKVRFIHNQDDQITRVERAPGLSCWKDG